MKLATLKSKLEKGGYTVKAVTAYNVHGTGKDLPALLVDTEYEGPYPPMEVHEKITALFAMAKKYKLHAETRGFYQAVLIWSNIE